MDHPRHPPRRTLVSALALALALPGCARAVGAAGAGDGGAGAGDAGAAQDTGVVAVDAAVACVDRGAMHAPAATYGNVPANCGNPCPASPDAPRVSGVRFRFGCDCTPGSRPVMTFELEVSDRDTPVDAIVTTAALMGCTYPGYRASGAAFSTDCGGGQFRGAWNVLLTDPQGNRASVYFEGPGECRTVRYACRPDPLGAFNFRCEP